MFEYEREIVAEAEAGAGGRRHRTENLRVHFHLGDWDSIIEVNAIVAEPRFPEYRRRDSSVRRPRGNGEGFVKEQR